MAEELEGTLFEYTYMYDQFSVFFYGDRVFIGKKDYPIGQCCADILNLDEAVLDEIDRRVRELVPAAMELLREKTDSAAALAQEKLNAVWELIFALPVYRDLKMDEPCSYHLFQRFMADEEKWAQVQDPTSEGHAIYQAALIGLILFAEQVRDFRRMINIVADEYLEPLKHRNSFAYAEAYTDIYTQMLYAGFQVFGEDFEQGISMEVDFVPMMHPTEKDKVFIAEKATFDSLVAFLQVEFYRGLAKGNASRRCHNCGRYFLLTSGHNVCFCNNIAPGETKRTCRKVGAHRKEAQGKENHTPAQKEYDKTYNRLKARKQRGKISKDEWNSAVAKAQDLLERSERGELSDEELKWLLAKL